MDDNLQPAQVEAEGPHAQTPPQTPSGKESPPPTPALPWLEWKPGERVVLRRREADGFYDALGDVLEVAPTHVVIKTRRGVVTVPAEKMVRGKRVPPPPVFPSQS